MLTVHIEWVDSLLLFSHLYNNYDALATIQRHQISRELDALQQEYEYLERKYNQQLQGARNRRLTSGEKSPADSLEQVNEMAVEDVLQRDEEQQQRQLAVAAGGMDSCEDNSGKLVGAKQPQARNQQPQNPVSSSAEAAKFSAHNSIGSDGGGGGGSGGGAGELRANWAPNSAGQTINSNGADASGPLGALPRPFGYCGEPQSQALQLQFDALNYRRQAKPAGAPVSGGTATAVASSVHAMSQDDRLKFSSSTPPFGGLTFNGRRSGGNNNSNNTFTNHHHHNQQLVGYTGESPILSPAAADFMAPFARTRRRLPKQPQQCNSPLRRSSLQVGADFETTDSKLHTGPNHCWPQSQQPLLPSNYQQFAGGGSYYEMSSSAGPQRSSEELDERIGARSLIQQPRLLRKSNEILTVMANRPDGLSASQTTDEEEEEDDEGEGEEEEVDCEDEDEDGCAGEQSSPVGELTGSSSIGGADNWRMDNDNKNKLQMQQQDKFRTTGGHHIPPAQVIFDPTPLAAKVPPASISGAVGTRTGSLQSVPFGGGGGGIELMATSGRLMDDRRPLIGRLDDAGLEHLERSRTFSKQAEGTNSGSNYARTTTTTPPMSMPMPMPMPITMPFASPPTHNQRRPHLHLQQQQEQPANQMHFHHHHQLHSVSGPMASAAAAGLSLHSSRVEAHHRVGVAQNDVEWLVNSGGRPPTTPMVATQTSEQMNESTSNNGFHCQPGGSGSQFLLVASAGRQLERYPTAVATVGGGAGTRDELDAGQVSSSMSSPPTTNLIATDAAAAATTKLDHNQLEGPPFDQVYSQRTLPFPNQNYNYNLIDSSSSSNFHGQQQQRLSPANLDPIGSPVGQLLGFGRLSLDTRKQH